MNSEGILPTFTKLNLDCGSQEAEHRLQKARQSLKRDKSVLNIGTPTELIGDGEHIFEIDNVPIKYVLFKGEDRYLHVFLAGHVRSANAIYQRWSFNNNCTTLAIADPMYTLHGCALGWYYGTTNIDYRKIVSGLIDTIANALNISQHNIIIYGGSGGGTAAIYVGHYLPGCTVFSINPQIDIRIWGKRYISALEKVLGCSIDSENLRSRNRISDILNTDSKTNYVLAVNCLSPIDNEMFRKLSEDIKISLNYGLNSKNNIYFWIYAAKPTPNGNGIFDYHGSMDNEILFNIINELLLEIIENEDIDCKKYLQYTILWSEIFNYKYAATVTNYELNKLTDDGKYAYGLYDMYVKGLGTSKDYKKAMDNLLISANFCYDQAENSLYNELLITSDSDFFNKGVEVFARLSAIDYKYPKFLAKIYSLSEHFKNLNAAIRWEEQYITGGGTDYKNYLNLLWNSCLENQEKMVIFCKNTITTTENPYCYAYLGLAYYNGIAVEKNIKLAEKYFLIAKKYNVGIASHVTSTRLLKTR